MGSLEPFLERLALLGGLVKFALVCAAFCGGFLIGYMPINASLVFGACAVTAFFISRRV